MRVWDIHPGYLSNQSLLGEHAEIHALCSIIIKKKSGYSMHPETRRWTGHLEFLVLRHDLIVKEMALRRFSHNSHLWGYFENKANLEEKSHFFNLPDSIKKLNYLFRMAEKYQQDYLLHSTIFADFLPCYDFTKNL